MRTLVSSITKWLYSETDKCEAIMKKMAERYANQQPIHAFIPEAWVFGSEDTGQRMIPREEAIQIFEKMRKDMYEKYRIDVEKVIPYGIMIADASEALKTMYAVMPIDKKFFLNMTGLSPFVEYVETEYAPHVQPEVIEPVFMLYMEWMHRMNRPENREVEHYACYNATDMICGNMSSMMDYCMNVFDIMEIFVREAGGVICGYEGGLKFCRIDDAKKLFDGIRGAVCSAYADPLKEMEFNESIGSKLARVMEHHMIQDSSADDSPMNDNAGNAKAIAIMIAAGLMALFIMIFFFSKLIVPIVVLAAGFVIVKKVFQR